MWQKLQMCLHAYSLVDMTHLKKVVVLYSHTCDSAWSHIMASCLNPKAEARSDVYPKQMLYWQAIIPFPKWHLQDPKNDVPSVDRLAIVVVVSSSKMECYQKLQVGRRWKHHHWWDLGKNGKPVGKCIAYETGWHHGHMLHLTLGSHFCVHRLLLTKFVLVTMFSQLTVVKIWSHWKSWWIEWR